jgi:hypothetical protein
MKTKKIFRVIIPIIIIITIASIAVSFFRYCAKKNNEKLDSELNIKNLYPTYASIEKLCTEYSVNLKEIINTVDECNENYDSVCFNMPLKTESKNDIQLYHPQQGHISMTEHLADELIQLNLLTGINYIECLYMGNTSDGYQIFRFVQTNYKKDDLNYLIYVRTTERPNIDSFSNMKKLLFHRYNLFSYNKIITSDTQGYWYFCASRDSDKYNLYYRLYDLIYNM